MPRRQRSISLLATLRFSSNAAGPAPSASLLFRLAPLSLDPAACTQISSPSRRCRSERTPTSPALAQKIGSSLCNAGYRGSLYVNPKVSEHGSP